MNLPKWILAPLYSLCLLLAEQSHAQTDPFRAVSCRWMQCCCRHHWDSALSYGRDLQVLTQKEFGVASPHYALVLSIIMGETYLAMNEEDSAIIFYHRGIELLKKTSDMTGRGYFTVLAQYKNATMHRTSNTDSLVSAWIGAARRKYNLEHAEEREQALYALMHRDTVNVKREPDSVIARRMLAKFTPPDYVNKAIVREAKYQLRKDWLESGEDEVLETLFDVQRGSVHMTLSDNGILQGKYAADSLSIFTFEDLYGAFGVLQHRLNDQQELPARNIIHNDNFGRGSPNLSLDQTYAIEMNIRKGEDYLVRKLYTPAELLFRREIRELRKARLSDSRYMQQSVAGLCSSLIFLQKYSEAADSLLLLSRETFTDMNKAFLKESESTQFERENTIAVIFDMLYTCLCHIKDPPTDLLKTAFTMELQRENEILSSHLDFTNKAREVLSHSVDPRRVAKQEEPDMQDYFFQQYYKLFMAERDSIRRQYLLPYQKRTLDIDSIEQSYGRFPGPETMVFDNGLIQRTMDSVADPEKWVNVQPPATADIEFIRFNYKTAIDEDSAVYAAFLFKPGELSPVFLPLCSEAALTYLLKDEKGRWIEERDLTQKIYDSAGVGTTMLYHLIWAPLEPYLTGIRNINYSSAGLLNNIALHAVYTGQDHLMNHYSLHRFLRLKEAGEWARPDHPPTAVSIWGNMDYGAGNYIVTGDKVKSAGAFSSLGPKEADTLKKIFSAHNITATYYEQKDATEENFKRQAASLKGVLHIATHGFYARLNKSLAKDPLPASFLCANTDPMLRCGLVFSWVNYYWIHGVPMPGLENGLLTGDEAAWLDLHNIQLVVLSACETGLGEVTDNEGNLGLQRAFKMAGADKLLVSLWKVNAEATTQLLSLFYTNWLKGMSASEALQEAEQALQRDGSFPSYYWAAFVLIE